MLYKGIHKNPNKKKNRSLHMGRSQSGLYKCIKQNRGLDFAMLSA